MPTTFDPSKDQVAELVTHYRKNREAFRDPKYKEARARSELIDPLFMALGWDVQNRARLAPQYQPVLIEASQEVEGHQRAPDYAFRVGRETKFYAEAKKPVISIKDDPSPAFQLRRYAWSAKLPLSILTDFEELAIYDCRLRPSEKDKATTGRLHFFGYEEYPDRWREVWDIFSYEAVLSGAFDQVAQSSKGKRGTSEVDAEFLKEIEHWRDALARNIALRNDLDIDTLNDAVQRTIDRIIFLRMAEDRGIEPYEQLKNLTLTPAPLSLPGRGAGGEGSIYDGLIALSRAADKKYNSGLFDFSKKGDTTTADLVIDDAALKPILAGLYFPKSPYVFNVLPVEILGNVYEQFLGKVIRLTAGGHAKVEEKPEVKKAGGVYYTPAYIVRYIVENTIGKLIAGKSPKQLRAFRVLDMACGSGSFLLGAYQYFLDYTLKWYTEHNPEKHREAVWKDNGVWRLRLAEKRRILTEHIFGVDIDRQAVEVTRLSLLLKLLEAESDQTLIIQLQLIEDDAPKDGVLPNLDANIKCGNSLIAPDYFDGRDLDDDELRRVNPFDWEHEFALTPTLSQREREQADSHRLQGEGHGAKVKPPLPPELLQRCRELRRNATDAEHLMWQLLRNRQVNGAKFRRQHPLGGYMLDFYCHEAQLAVELDGGGHAAPEQATYDAKRTRDLAELGVRVIRFWNNEVLQNTEAVLQAIWEALIPALTPTLSQRERERADSPLPLGEGPGVRGNFDVIVGNPPYIRIQTMKEWAPLEVEAYKQLYASAASGNYDIYVVFVEKGLSLLKKGGRLGFILPSKFFSTDYGQPLRGLISESASLAQVVDFGHAQVFEQATTYTCLLFLAKAASKLVSYSKVEQPPSLATSEPAYRAMDVKAFTSDPWGFTTDSEKALAKRLALESIPLSEVPARIGRGSSSGADDVFMLQQRGKTFTTREGELVEIEKNLLRTPIYATDFRRYSFNPQQEEAIIFPYHISADGYSLISESELKRQYPKAHKYLLSRRAELESRKQFQAWYGFSAPRNLEVHEAAHILVPLLADRGLYCRLPDKVTQFCLMASGGFSITIGDAKKMSPNYVLGLLNSKLLFWRLKSISNVFRGGWITCTKQYVETLPIRVIDFSDPADKEHHDRIASLVETMLDLHKRLAAADSAAKREPLQRQIDATDRKIDQLVYDLYGLTGEEIAIVEGG